jgi:hypothetical protein
MAGSGFNPALLAEDAMEIYTLYNRRKDQELAKKKGGHGTSAPGVEKKAFFNRAHLKTITAIADRTERINAFKDYAAQASKRFVRDSVLSPTTVGLTGGAVASSMYGPEWAGGPGEDQEKGFDAKRALKNVVTFNLLGRAVLGTPRALFDAATGTSSPARTYNLLKGVGGTVAATHLHSELSKEGDPNINKVMGTYAKASIPAAAFSNYHQAASMLANM